MTARLIARVLSYLDYLGKKKISGKSPRRTPVLSDRMCRAVFPSTYPPLLLKVKETPLYVFIEQFRMAVVMMEGRG